MMYDPERQGRSADVWLTRFHWWADNDLDVETVGRGSRDTEPY